MENTGTIDPITGDATEQTGTESTGQGTVAPQGSQEQTDNAGQPQGQSEDGKEQETGSRGRFRSKNQTIYELRQAVRERDAKLTDFENRISQFEQQIQQRPQNQKPSRTFWEAPDETINGMLEDKLKHFQEEIFE